MGSKDKQKVIGEQLDENQVKRFLELEAETGVNQDFHVLLKAYRGLPVDAFARFVDLFLASGRDINAKDQQGNTLLSQVVQHKSHPEYADLLRQKGAVDAG